MPIQQLDEQSTMLLIKEMDQFMNDHILDTATGLFSEFQI